MDLEQNRILMENQSYLKGNIEIISVMEWE